MVYNFFDKSSGGGIDFSLTNKSATEANYQHENELHRQIILKPNRRKVYSSFRDNIWGVDSTDMQSLSKYKYLLCVIYLFSRYAWIVPLKDKRGITVVTGFEKIKRMQTK